MRKRIDLIGHKYGRLTVIEEVAQIGKHRRFRCLCDCGKEIIVKMYSLRSGNTKSCGCLKSEIGRMGGRKGQDLTGRLFGELVALEKLQDGRWLCRCSCGNTKALTSSDLLSGNNKTCGHWRQRRDFGVNWRNRKEYHAEYYRQVTKPKRNKQKKPGLAPGVKENEL